MKIPAQLTLVLLTAMTSLLSLIPVDFLHAAQIQSGVTIIAPSSPPPPPPSPTSPPAGTTPTATCGLQLVSGVPINYGQLMPQPGLGFVRSMDQQVSYKNIGNATAQVMVKGGNWVGGIVAGSNQIYSGPEWTHVASSPNVDWGMKKALQSSETSLGQIMAGQTGASFWQVQIPTNTGISGSLHQDVTIDLTC